MIIDILLIAVVLLVLRGMRREYKRVYKGKDETTNHRVR